MALIGLAAAWAAVIGRSFARDTRHTIQAVEVEATDRRWLALAALTPAVPRQLEVTSANRGLAEWTA